MTMNDTAETGTGPNSRESVDASALSPRSSSDEPVVATQRLSSQRVSSRGSRTTTTSPTRTARQRRSAVNRSPGLYVGIIEDPSTVTRRAKYSRIRLTPKRYRDGLTSLLGDALEFG